MKPAQVADVWRRLRASPKKISNIVLAWTGVPRLTNNVLQINQPFSIICGENGVGKSTILHVLLHALVAPSRRSESAVFVRNEEGEVAYVRVELGYGVWGAPRTLISVESVREHFESGSEGLRVALFDPAMHLPMILNAILADANFSEVIEPIGPRLYSPAQVADLSYVVGRDYEEVSSYEIDSYGGLGVFPYFKVKVAGIEYGSEGMGFGEHSLLLAYWLLSRMPTGSVILLEEPETFVSPRSQGRLVNVAARIALDSELTVIATTHSPSIVSRFKPNEITLVSRAGRNVTLKTPVEESVLERRLELINPVRRLWLVEDASAARFLSFFLSQAGLASVSDVLIVGNNDAVFASAGMRAFGDSRIILNGILDGDERKRRSSIPLNMDFLPGDVAPEVMLKQVVSTADRVATADAIGVTVEELELALAAAGGEEVHQWIHAMRADLAVSLDQFVAGVLTTWAVENSAILAAFVARLRVLAKIDE